MGDLTLLSHLWETIYYIVYRQVPKLGALRPPSVPPKKGLWDTHWYGQQKGARFIGLGMDARSAGELGGRPTKAVSLGKRAAAAVAHGSQRTLNFGLIILEPSHAAPTCSTPLKMPPTPGPPTRPTGTTSPPTRPTAPPREKGARTFVLP